jgi:hypothetical protein
MACAITELLRRSYATPAALAMKRRRRSAGTDDQVGVEFGLAMVFRDRGGCGAVAGLS